MSKDIEKSKLWQAARREKNRLCRLLEQAPEEKRAALRPIAENAAWMKAQLDKAREDIDEEALVIEYDNGGGQSGIRENPAFRAYENLWRAYIAGMDKIIAALPEKEAEQASAPEADNVLNMLMAKRRAQA